MSKRQYAKSAFKGYVDNQIYRPFLNSPTESLQLTWTPEESTKPKSLQISRRLVIYKLTENPRLCFPH